MSQNIHIKEAFFDTVPKARELIELIGRLPPSNPVLKKGVALEHIGAIAQGSMIFAAGIGNPLTSKVDSVQIEKAWLLYLLADEGLALCFDPIHKSLTPAFIEENPEGGYGPILVPIPMKLEAFIQKVTNKELVKTMLFHLDMFEG